jgi:dihydrofolate reductase
LFFNALLRSWHQDAEIRFLSSRVQVESGVVAVNTAEITKGVAMRIALIAAMAEHRVIGRGGVIPWKIPGEQKLFKRITLGHAVIMGRRTYESIRRPLPGRTNIVVSRRPDFRPEGCLAAPGLAAALALCPTGEEEVFIIGGGQLYREAMPIADRIYLTVLPLTVDGDAFFPEIPAEAFAITSAERIPGPPPYDFLIYDRICHR